MNKNDGCSISVMKFTREMTRKKNAAFLLELVV